MNNWLINIDNLRMLYININKNYMNMTNKINYKWMIFRK